MNYPYKAMALTNRQRRSAIERFWVEAGRALIRTGYFLQFALADYLVKISKTIRSALLDKLHALFRSDLTISPHDRCRSRTTRGVIGGHGALD